jgi:hypothetical protein
MKTVVQGLTQTQEHDHNRQDVPRELTLRVKALEPLLVEEGFVDPAALDARSNSAFELTFRTE